MLKEAVKQSKTISVISNVKSSQLLWTLAFSFLMVLAANVAVPVKPVPFTLQTMIVLLSGAFLGARNGAFSQIIYLALGLIGLPVFANFNFGPAALIGPTGGYLLSWPFAAYLVGYLVERNKSTLNISLAMIVAHILILLTGALYLSVFFNGNLETALFSGAIIFTPWDAIKVAAAISIYKVLSSRYPKLSK
ncbi:MAG: biotin transporter BioY [Melioribacteraceae bacterium]|nr:biotin transporter BioY [Melioribacteraceae bacterium]